MANKKAKEALATGHGEYYERFEDDTPQLRLERHGQLIDQGLWNSYP
jgi:hypothetical protein